VSRAKSYPLKNAKSLFFFFLLVLFFLLFVLKKKKEKNLANSLVRLHTPNNRVPTEKAGAPHFLEPLSLQGACSSAAMGEIVFPVCELEQAKAKQSGNATYYFV
jgi:hypothetical protein